MKEKKSHNNYRNAFVLYGRSFLILFLSLCFSRCSLKNIGTEQYGIYLLLLDIINVFSFVDAILSTTTLRFLAYSLGENADSLLQQKNKTEIVIYQIKNIYCVVSFVCFIVFLIIGEYLIKYVLKISPSYRTSAQFIFITMLFWFILTFFFNFYNMILLSYEKFIHYTVITCLDAFLKVAVAVSLRYVSDDKLYFYTFGILAEGMIVFLLYHLSSKGIIHVPLLRFKHFPLKQYIPLVSYIGWSSFGGFVFTINKYGVNIILNLYCGILANTAAGLTNQLAKSVQTCTSCILSMFTPQLTKSYAANNRDELEQLIKNSSRIIFVLTVLFAAGIIVNLPILLSLWLKDIPQYMMDFTVLMLVSVPFELLSQPLTTLAQASGKVKQYYIILIPWQIGMVVVTWLMYQAGGPSYSLYISKIIFDILCIGVRLFFLKKYTHTPLSKYLRNVIVPCIIFLFIVICLGVCTSQIQHSILRFIVSVFSVGITGVLLSGFIVFNKEERQSFLLYVTPIIKRLYHG